MDNSSTVTANIMNLNKHEQPTRNGPLCSDALFVHSDVIVIQHQDEQYRLRLTRNGKLILTK